MNNRIVVQYIYECLDCGAVYQWMLGLWCSVSMNARIVYECIVVQYIYECLDCGAVYQ